MPTYTKTTWVNGTTPAINATNLNKIEDGIFDAMRQDGSTTMTGQLVTTAGSAGTPAIAPTGDSNTGLFFPAADTIGLSVGGTERLRFTSSGYLGLGTTTPNAFLEAQGAGGTVGATITNTNSGNYSFLSLRNTGTSGIDYQLVNGGSASANPNLFYIYDATNNATRFAINSAGKIAMNGTNINGNYILNISGTTAASGTFGGLNVANMTGGSTVGSSIKLGFISDFYGARITAYANSSAVYPADLAFEYGNGTTYLESMRINSSGNVGIGTASPSAYSGRKSVCINGTDGGILELMVGGTTKSQIYMESAAVPDTVIYNAAGSAGVHRFQTNSSEVMRITTAGNVGIGTTSPTVATNVTSVCANGTSGAYFEGFVNGTRTSTLTTTSASVTLRNLTNNPLLFFTNATERFQVEAGGTVRPSANNTYELGSSSFRWSTIYAQNALNTSDARLKTDVEPSSLGLDFINALNPVQYKYIEGGNTVERVESGTEEVLIQEELKDEEGNVIQEAVYETQPKYEVVTTPVPGVRTHFGLIAQEVKAALPADLDFGGWCLADKNDPNSIQSLGYTQLIAPMIKAIQELTARIEQLEAQK